MSKLISLAEKPVTKEDIGKILYSTTGREIIIKQQIVDVLEDIDIDMLPQWFWSKPVTISEEEYEALQAENIKLKEANAKQHHSIVLLNGLVERAMSAVEIQSTDGSNKQQMSNEEADQWLSDYSELKGD